MTVTDVLLPCASPSATAGTGGRRDVVRAPHAATFRGPERGELPRAGDVVTPGQCLGTLETAGRHLEVRATERGVISQVAVEVGRPVHGQAMLFDIEVF